MKDNEQPALLPDNRFSITAGIHEINPLEINISTEMPRFETITPTTHATRQRKNSRTRKIRRING